MGLCDTHGGEGVSNSDLYNILKQNIFNHDDKVKLKRLIKRLYKEFDED